MPQLQRGPRPAAQEAHGSSASSSIELEFPRHPQPSTMLIIFSTMRQVNDDFSDDFSESRDTQDHTRPIRPTSPPHDIPPPRELPQEGCVRPHCPEPREGPEQLLRLRGDRAAVQVLRRPGRVHHRRRGPQGRDAADDGRRGRDWDHQGRAVAPWYALPSVRRLPMAS